MEENSHTPDQPNLEDLISLKEAADLSGVSHDHLRWLAGEGTCGSERSAGID